MQKLSRSQRAADAVTEFCGSWTFIAFFSALTAGWIVVNTAWLIFRGAFDPYPFILFNLVLTIVSGQYPVAVVVLEVLNCYLDTANAVETDFAVDSSGFSSCVFERWFDIKWGKMRSEHQWVKAHLMTGVTTNIVTSVENYGIL